TTMSLNRVKRIALEERLWQRAESDICHQRSRAMDIPAYEAAFAPDELLRIGTLYMPSGKVVACDPFFCASASAFSRQIAPGEYEIQVRSINTGKWGRRIAFARVIFKKNDRAHTLEKAMMDSGSDGFFVDAGIASYMDELTRAKFADVLD